MIKTFISVETGAIIAQTDCAVLSDGLYHHIICHNGSVVAIRNAERIDGLNGIPESECKICGVIVIR